MRPKIKLLAVAIGVLSAAVLPTTPASAATTLTFTFIASASTDASPGVPCTLGNPCPGTTSTTTKTDGFGLTVTNITTDGPTRAFGWGSTLCFDGGSNKGKAAKFPAQWGPCSWGGAGAITGYCALATGTGSAFITDSLGQSYSISWKLTWTGPSTDVSTMTFTGTATKDSNGRSGDFRATAVAQVGFGTCLDQTANNWQLYGEGVIRILN